MKHRVFVCVIVVVDDQKIPIDMKVGAAAEMHIMGRSPNGCETIDCETNTITSCPSDPKFVYQPIDRY